MRLRSTRLHSVGPTRLVLPIIRGYVFISRFAAKDNRKMVEVKGFEPFHPLRERGYSPLRLSNCAALPCGQYRLVCAAGFEPATPCAQDTCATTALRTEIDGRGLEVDMAVWYHGLFRAASILDLSSGSAHASFICAFLDSARCAPPHCGHPLPLRNWAAY